MGFSRTRNVEADLLGITSVHPMGDNAVRSLLTESGTNWRRVERLIQGNLPVEIDYRGQKFYVRCFPRADDRSADTSEGEYPACR
jgi:hypothetical protein